MNTDKKAKARESLRYYIKSKYGKEPGELSKDMRGIALTRWYIEEIHNRTHSPIDEEEINAGLSDGKNDCGVDFIYKDDDTVYIFQSKYYSQGSHVEQEDVSHFQRIFFRLLNPAIKKNNILQDVLAGIDFQHDNFKLIFNALAKFGDNTKVAISDIPHQPDIVQNLASRTTYEYYNEEELNIELRNALSLSEGVPESWPLFSYGHRADRSAIIEIHHDRHPSYVIVLDGKQIFNLYNKFHDRLFTMNIRSYIGDNVTNKGIINTAIDQPYHFFHYNNGISALATKVTVDQDSGKLTTEGLQIINGAQTVRSIHKAFAKVKDKEQDRIKFEPLLLARITEIKDGYGSAGRFRDEIVRFNNTQNKIKASDFRSNDAVQNDLRVKFATLQRNGRAIEYTPKRTDKPKQKGAIIIKLEEFSKTIYSFLVDPVSFSGSTSFLFDDSPAGGYCKVFGDGKEAWTVVPDEEFKLRAALWWIATEFTEQLQHDREISGDSIEKNALERKWILFYTARAVLEKTYAGDAWKIAISSTYKGRWALKESKTGEWMERLYVISKRAITYIYKEAMNEKDFNHRNWMRNKLTPQKIQTFIKTAPIEDLPKLNDGN